MSEWLGRGHDKGSICADPKIADPESGDFSLESDSPAWKLGFQPIPLEKIGLFADDFRHTLPKSDTRKAPRRPFVQKVNVELKPDPNAASTPAASAGEDHPTPRPLPDSFKAGPLVSGEKTVGLHATLIGILVQKKGQVLTLHIESAKPESDNNLDDFDSLHGKSIKIPLTSILTGERKRKLSWRPYK